MKDLCDLKLDQVTFAGSHNAGSGFDGVLHYWSGGAVSSCFYRNHGLSFDKQLDFGVRFFELTLVGIAKTMKLSIATALEQKGKTALMPDQ